MGIGVEDMENLNIADLSLSSHIFISFKIVHIFSTPCYFSGII